MKKSVILLSIASLILIVLGVYLFVKDKPTVVHSKIITGIKIITITGVPNPDPGVPALQASNITLTPHTLPPPWYANLWPETLIVGIVLLIIALLLLRPPKLDRILDYI